MNGLGVGVRGQLGWRPVWDGRLLEEGSSPPTRVTVGGVECLELELPAASAKAMPGTGGHYLTWAMLDQDGREPDWTEEGPPSVLMLRVREVGSSDLSAGHEYGVWFSNRSDPLDSLNFGGSVGLAHLSAARRVRTHNFSAGGLGGAPIDATGAGIAGVYGNFVPNITRRAGGGADIFSVTLNRGVAYGVNADESAAVGSAVPVPQAPMGGVGAPKIGVYLGHAGVLASPVTVRFVAEYALITLPYMT